MVATARIYRAGFALIGLYALGLQYRLILATPVMGAPDMTSGELTLNFFSYFTILTNILIALAMLLAAIAPNHAIGRFALAPSPRSGLTMYAVVVGLIYHFLLHSTWNPTGWALIANILLHYVMPLAMLLDWLMFTQKGHLNWRDPVIWLLFPLTYGVWTLIHGYASGWWPYWFINADMLGLGRTLINFSALLVFFCGLGLLVVLIDGWLRPKNRAG